MAKVLSLAWVSLVFASVMLSGCSDSGQGTSSQTEEQLQNDTGINVLTSVFPSPKEQNPYSVENMNKTFKDFILANSANAEDIPELEANFLYVRFLPYGKQGVYELKTYDTSLVLFKHPITGEGSFQNSRLHENRVTHRVATSARFVLCEAGFILMEI